MKAMKYLFVTVLLVSFLQGINAQQIADTNRALNNKQQSIVRISSYTAKGALQHLSKSLNDGLNAGLTINQIREVLAHTYAYCGFPRSIRGLQTFMQVLIERKAKSINDVTGAEPSPVKNKASKYQRGKKILDALTNTPQQGPLTGYSAFAPIIDTFLKEHLFADIFERDVLTYGQRELVTISVLSTIGSAEPMLQSHLKISLNVGLTPLQLKQFIKIIKSTAGRKKSKSASKVLDQVIKVTNAENN